MKPLNDARVHLIDSEKPKGYRLFGYPVRELGRLPGHLPQLAQLLTENINSKFSEQEMLNSRLKALR